MERIFFSNSPSYLKREFYRDNVLALNLPESIVRAGAIPAKFSREDGVFSVPRLALDPILVLVNPSGA
jgi:hypothetical protein